ncbi:MAG: TIGR02147 family protein [Acidobacteria bacterium]|nr:TIGR02147 family protein [Acidobacteriota bacterium]
MKALPQRSDLRTVNASGFRLYLQTELARRCSHNRQYSLRSFALQLDVDHSTLSQVLRGKRRLTTQMIEKFGRRLNLSQEDIEAFVAQAELMKSGKTVMASMAQQLTLDAVQLLSDTRHQSILELLQLEYFRPDVRWIARVLNTAPDEVNIALSRLLRLGLLEMATPDRWLDKSDSLCRDRNDFAAQVIRKLSEQVRKLSARSGRR